MALARADAVSTTDAARSGRRFRGHVATLDPPGEADDQPPPSFVAVTARVVANAEVRRRGLLRRPTWAHGTERRATPPAARPRGAPGPGACKLPRGDGPRSRGALDSGPDGHGGGRRGGARRGCRRVGVVVVVARDAHEGEHDEDDGEMSTRP